MTDQPRPRSPISRGPTHARLNLPVRVLVRLAAVLAFRNIRQTSQTHERPAKHDPPAHGTLHDEAHDGPASKSLGEDLTAEVKLMAWWSGGLSLLTGVGVYLIGIILLVGPMNLADLIDGAQKQFAMRSWGYGPGSVALGAAAAALTMFVATTLSDSWRFTGRPDDRRELGRRVATANLTNAVYLLGASLTWAILMDALVTQLHHPVEVLTTFLVMLLCVGLFAVAASPDDVQHHRAKERDWERAALRQVIHDLSDRGSSKRLARWWSAGLKALVLTVVVVWAAVEFEIRRGGNEEAHLARGLLVFLGPLSFVQAVTSARSHAARALKFRMHRRKGVPWWIGISLVGVLVFVSLASIFALGGMWWVAIGLMLAPVAPMGVLHCYKRAPIFNRDVVRLAKALLRSGDGSSATVTPTAE